MALTEVNSSSRRQGLWAKALSESLGDEQKTTALYIRYRAEQLQEQKVLQAQAAEEERRNEVIVYSCPGCRTKRRKVTKGMIEDRQAAKHPNWRFKCADCNEIYDLRDVLPSLREKSSRREDPDSDISGPAALLRALGFSRQPKGASSMQDMTVYFRYERHGEVVLIKNGFSWPGLFCGAMHAWYRGMTAEGFKWWAFAFFTVGISWFVYPFLANEIYGRHLSNSGWRRRAGFYNSSGQPVPVP